MTGLSIVVGAGNAYVAATRAWGGVTHTPHAMQQAKESEVRAARYCSTWVSQRVEARAKQGSSGVEHTPTMSPQPARVGAGPSAWASPAANPGSDVGSQLPTPIFTRRLAARSQALQSPSAAQGGLSTVQVRGSTHFAVSRLSMPAYSAPLPGHLEWIPFTLLLA